MNKKVLSLIILFLGVVLAVNAQSDSRITIKGSIFDNTTGEPVPFANLGLLGTVAGTASDMDGKFELSVPDKYATYVIRVSAVGYSPYEIKVYEAKEKGDLRINLIPVAYGIGEVDVYAESLVYKKMLKNVVDNISKNYINKPYNYQGYFEYKISTNGVEGDTKEAIVTLYDNKGYNRSDVVNAFKEVNYKFNEVRRNHPVNSIYDGLNYFDDIVTADIIRNTRNVLDIDNARDFKLKNKGKLVYEGDSVRVIAYEVINPTISTTGSTNVTKCSGEIYINLKDFAVLKNIIHIEATDFTQLGRNLMPVNQAKKEKVNMTITTNYKKLNAVYFLSGATIVYTYKDGANDVKGEMQYVTTKVNMKNPETITGRMYYEDIAANKKFWDSYSVYFTGEE